MSTSHLSFQEAILRLQAFWGRRGCLLWQPYSEKVGAGTMSPATVLRVLGPEPWSVAYVEPSYRPDDGRYGENPNRMQMHMQYQVILKPGPGNPQEIYLESLEALGVRRHEHDIRFVEDQWESPPLGAWGLGWEVWMDGQEITQFTYFQQAGGIPLEFPAVEITYGLERIIMSLQGVCSVWEIDWDGTRTYGEVLLRNEVEHCVYDFEAANVARLRQMYDLFEAEAHACIGRGLVIPAYDCILRCSHTFNVLDARGAIGVTERAHYFARMREAFRKVAEAFLAQREALGYPLLKAQGTGSPAPVVPTSEGLSDDIPAQPQDFVLEIGTEELPVADINAALGQLAEAMKGLLEASPGIPYQALRVMGTPRRLVVYVQGLAGRQSQERQEVTGPPAEVAFDAQGRPTRAAEGFARSRGVEVGALQVKAVGAKRYVVANVPFGGQATARILAEKLPGLIGGLQFGKAMRWDGSGISFSRPIRWLVALYGQQVIPFVYAGVVSGRVSRGLRPDGSPDLNLSSVSDYLPTLKAQGIIADKVERTADIQRQAAALAAEVGGAVPDDPALLDEVTNLVEQPTALRGEFAPEYLALPSDVLITAMKKHQRYFPVVDQSGALLPHFIVVRNGDGVNTAGVRHGYEEVLRARFADAAFFFEADRRQPLEDFLPRLDTLVFQQRLGSMLDKAGRVEALVPVLAASLGLSEAEQALALRAAHLCKADLATRMVVEFTSLQGVMGREYALRSGESPTVAQAIAEHYLPRFMGDALPQSRLGIALGLADRLDTLLGLFAVGLEPTGTADPYGLRRAAAGLVQILLQKDLALDLGVVLQAAAALLPVSGPVDLQPVLRFIAQRMRVWLREGGYRHDVVEAVLATGRPLSLMYGRIKALNGWVERPEWMDLLNAYARCVRIVRDLDETLSLDPGPLAGSGQEEPATKALYRAYLDAAERITLESTVDELCQVLWAMVPTINRFFDEVLVMAEDRARRENRLALLQRIAALADGIVDLSRVMGF